MFLNHGRQDKQHVNHRNKISFWPELGGMDRVPAIHPRRSPDRPDPASS